MNKEKKIFNSSLILEFTKIINYYTLTQVSRSYLNYLNTVFAWLLV